MKNKDKDLGPFQKFMENYLFVGVGLVKIIVYILTAALVIKVLINVYASVFFNANTIKDMDIQKYNKIKILLNNTISVCLSGIVFVELLKLFYIKTFRQLGIVAGIVVIKLVILHFVEEEQKSSLKMYKNNKNN